MPQITTKSFTDLVSLFAQTVEGAAKVLADFTLGSLLRALAEAVAGVVIWLESLILLLLATTRLSTSSGNDVDTFVGDFGLTRLPAVAAEGTVTFARFTDTFAAVILVGTVVSTSDLSESYTVIADTSQPAYNATQNAYLLPAGTASISATVQCTVAGTQGNVAANTITVLQVAIPYVDTVTNALAFGNGENAETDAALKARFVAWFGSLAKATYAAIMNAILSVQVGAVATLTENQNYNGTANPGYFYAVVDDGSGAPPSAFITACETAIEAVRAFTVTYGVFATTTVVANVSGVLTVSSGYTLSIVEAQVEAAITAYIQGLEMGVTLSYGFLYNLCFTVPGVTNVNNLTLNGGTADLVTTAKSRVIPGTIAFS